jgi:uncharacterized membrane protein (UPF0127 family)
MFRKSLGNDEGIMIVENSEGVISSSIHMFFMKINLGIIWLNENKKVVDKCHAIRWNPYYASNYPACYTLEIHPSRLNEFETGDQLVFHEYV